MASEGREGAPTTLAAALNDIMAGRPMVLGHMEHGQPAGMGHGDKPAHRDLHDNTAGDHVHVHVAGGGVAMMLTITPPPTGGRRRTQFAASPFTAMRTLPAPPDLVSGAQFGAALAYAADYDGNGASELMVGAPGSVQGSVALHYMDSGGLRAYRTVQITASESELGGGANVSEFGRSIVNLGALNLGDIVEDVAAAQRAARQCEHQRDLAAGAAGHAAVAAARAALFRLALRRDRKSSRGRGGRRKRR